MDEVTLQVLRIKWRFPEAGFPLGLELSWLLPPGKLPALQAGPGPPVLPQTDGDRVPWHLLVLPSPRPAQRSKPAPVRESSVSDSSYSAAEHIATEAPVTVTMEATTASGAGGP